MSPYPRDVEQTMRSFYRSLRENDRRRYAAVEAAKLGHGGIEYIAEVLGIDPKTIRHGRRDLDDLPERPEPRVRKAGGGRKRLLDDDPQIDDDFQRVLVEHTAGSPTEESLIWTDLTKTEIVDLMQECGSYVSVHIVDQLLDRHGFHERKALRMRPLARHPDRDAQFETIARLKRESLDSADPILSMDLKSRELLGDFFRSGTLWTRETIRVFDHDFAEFAQGVVLPHGIYDLKLNRGYIHLGTSHDTSEFACDSLKDWWERFGRTAYPAAHSILLLCDGGGSNPADNDNGQAPPVPDRRAAAGQRPGDGDPGGALPAVCVEVQPDRTSLVPAPDARLPGRDPPERRPGGRTDEEGQDADRSLGAGGYPRQGLRDRPKSEPSHQGRREPGPRYRLAAVELSHLAQSVISGSYCVSVPQGAAGPQTAAEAVTPTIQPVNLPLQADRPIECGDDTNPIAAAEPGDETKPVAAAEPGDETKPNPPELEVEAAGEPALPTGVAAMRTRQDPCDPRVQMILEAFRDMSRRSMP